MLLGCASAPGSLAAHPSRIALGPVRIGELATGQLTLSHTGESTWAIQEVSVSDPAHWSVALLDSTLNPGQEELLTIGFVSQSHGTFSAKLTVHGEHGGALTLPLEATVLAPETETESIGSPVVFSTDPSVVHALELTLPDEAIDALRAQPTAWVEGTVSYQGQTWSQVGLRLKGSASFQSIDGKPAWKIKFAEYVEGQRFHGLERLTLNNEVWDATMMAETMSYWVWRDNGSPAPRTSYASVTLNGVLLGTYAVLESMDDDFMDHTWPGSNGGVYEMTRNCDFTGDCSCFELQETGPDHDPDGITRGCEAVAIGTADALAEAFDWKALIAFLAVELSVNHPDS
jgi:hypothetical protein